MWQVEAAATQRGEGMVATATLHHAVVKVLELLAVVLHVDGSIDIQRRTKKKDDVDKLGARSHGVNFVF